ncbi:MAG: STAS domain-containing protein [Pseudomonadales bacterium]
MQDLRHEGEHLFLSGDITSVSAQQYRDRLESVLMQVSDQLYADFSAVGHVDTSVLALCLSLQRQAKQCGFKLHFCNVSSQMISIAESVGLGELFA